MDKILIQWRKVVVKIVDVYIGRLQAVWSGIRVLGYAGKGKSRINVS